MYEYQFDQSSVIIQSDNDEARSLEQELEDKIKNNKLSLWDMDTGNVVGNNFDHFLWTAGLGNQKIIFDSTVSYLAFGDNIKDTAADKPIETYSIKPTSGQNITILSGRKAGLDYTANGESGSIINTVGKLTVHADIPNFIEANGNRKYLSGKDQSTGQYITTQKGNWTIRSGDADNEIGLGVGSQTVIVGNGNNKIVTDHINQDTDITQLNQHISAGNGDNTITAAGNVTITSGNGNDTIHAASYNSDTNLTQLMQLTQSINGGNGDNLITALGNATITSGNGNDTIEMNLPMIDQSNNDQIHNQVTTKDGKKYINFVGNTEITAGNGLHNIHQAYQDWSYISPDSNIKNHIHLGNGRLEATFQCGMTTVTAGNGGGSVDINGGYLNLTAGDGNYYIDSFGSYDLGHNIIHLGKGINTIDFAKSSKNSSHDDITTGDGDDSISLGGSYNTVHAGLGHNNIVLWSDYMDNGYSQLGHNNIYTDFGSFNTIRIEGTNNNIYSLGQDTINAYTNFNNYQTNVTLLGGNSEVNVTNATIMDLSSHNQITTKFSSTITGSSDSIIRFTKENSDPHNLGHNDLFIGGNNDTVSATEGSNLKAIRGSNNQFTVDGNFTFLDGTGDNTATVNGNTTVQGTDGLNLTLNVKGKGDNIFQAGNGNETLNGTQSQVALRVYANHDQQNYNSNLVASTGAGDDILYAGIGDSTFSGGLGNNTFVFDKKNDNYRMETTVITDFSASKGNKIALFDYGLNQDNLNTILQNATDDGKGNAILNLGINSYDHITLQGVNASDLHADQFILTPTDNIAKPA